MEPNQEEIKQNLSDTLVNTNKSIVSKKGTKIILGYFSYFILYCFILYLFKGSNVNSLSWDISRLSFFLIPLSSFFLFLNVIWFCFKKDKKNTNEYLRAFVVSIIIIIAAFLLLFIVAPQPIISNM